MPYNGDLTNPIMEVRLNIGDTHDDIEILKDADYQYFLEKYEGNVRRATLDAARAILFKLSRLSRERIEDVGELYSNDWFKNYRAALLDLLRNPEMTISVAMPYAGGISKSDMYANDNNSDNVTRDIYIGFTEGKKLYEQDNPQDKPTSFLSL